MSYLILALEGNDGKDIVGPTHAAIHLTDEVKHCFDEIERNGDYDDSVIFSHLSWLFMPDGILVQGLDDCVNKDLKFIHDDIGDLNLWKGTMDSQEVHRYSDVELVVYATVRTSPYFEVWSTDFEPETSFGAPSKRGVEEMFAADEASIASLWVKIESQAARIAELEKELEELRGWQPVADGFTYLCNCFSCKESTKENIERGWMLYQNGNWLGIQDVEYEEDDRYVVLPDNLMLFEKASPCREAGDQTKETI